MTGLDWGALALVAVSAFVGWRRGLIGSALSLAGVILGAMLGARIAPHLLHGGSRSPYTPIAALIGATLGAAVLQTGGVLLGGLARGSMRLSPLRQVDSIAGLLLGTAVGLALVWVLGAVALLLPGHPGLRLAAQRSEIVRGLNEAVSPRRVLNALARIDPFPSIVTPGAPPRAPDPLVRRDPRIGAAGHSVFRITGTACGLGVEGSGWVARPGFVVTAAHVVAGQSDTQVQSWDGLEVLPAETVVYDPHNDLAVLRVPGLSTRPLPLADPRSDTPVALIGYPGNGPLTYTPGRIGRTSSVFSEDAYGRRVVRTVTILSGHVRHGDSGGPAVDRSGAVDGVVFAARTDSPDSGYAVPSDLVRSDLARAHGPVSTGACID